MKEQFSDEGPPDSLTFGMQISCTLYVMETPCKTHPCPQNGTAPPEGIDMGLQGTDQHSKPGSKSSLFLLNMQSFNATQSWSSSPPFAPLLRKQINCYYSELKLQLPSNPYQASPSQGFAFFQLPPKTLFKWDCFVCGISLASHKNLAILHIHSELCCVSSSRVTCS